jgi:predicted short-subunit dehydrogenase-like oxidoreductase (DUF2520 family)
VSRGDAATVAAHLAVLPPRAVPAYRALARRTADRARRAGLLTGDQAATIEAIP